MAIAGTKATCKECGVEFFVTLSDMRRGRGTFCSRACAGKNHTGKPRSDRGRKTEARVCDVCKTEFLVGGRGHRDKESKFCGRKCANLVRHRRCRSLCLEMSQIDAAYLAGFIDGEGSIILFERSGCLALRLTASNTNRAVLEWIGEATGVGGLVSFDRNPARYKISNWWQVNSEGAESVIKQIRPYLKIKAAQADLALECIAKLRDPALKADRTWQLAAIEQMRAMNARGPKAA